MVGEAAAGDPAGHLDGGLHGKMVRLREKDEGGRGEGVPWLDAATTQTEQTKRAGKKWLKNTLRPTLYFPVTLCPPPSEMQ